MFARPRLKKLIKTLLQINGGSTRHVVEKVAFAVPRERRTHCRSITRVKEIIRPRKILGFGERCRRVAKVRRVIIEKCSAKLSGGTAGKGNTHRCDRLHRRSLDTKQTSAPLGERMCKGGAGSGLGWNQLVPHGSGLDVKNRLPFPLQRVRIKDAMRLEKLLAGH